jgi:hypothetical protein
MWVGEFKVQTTHQLLRKNALFEDRTVQFFELPTTKESREALRLGLVSRLGKEYRYDFFRRNCGHYIFAWLSGLDFLEPSLLYFTPREAVSQILLGMPPVAMRTFHSGTSLITQYLRNETGIRYAPRLSNEQLEDFASSDLALRLLILRLRMNHVEADEFESIRHQLTEALRSPSGSEAAERLVRFEMGLFSPSQATWLRMQEGPAIQIGSVFSAGSQTSGTHFRLEAGIRDWHSQPRDYRTLRSTHFLATELMHLDNSVQGTFTLAELETERAVNHLHGEISNGLALSYSGLPNPTGVRGLQTSAWIGPSFEFEGFWIGARLTGSLSEIQDRAQVQIGPGMTTHFSFHRLSLAGTVSSNSHSGFGWSSEAIFDLDSYVSVKVEIVSDPELPSLITAGIQARF